MPVFLSIWLCSFFPPKAKDVHSNNKRKEKYEKISLIKGISCHTRRLIFPFLLDCHATSLCAGRKAVVEFASLSHHALHACLLIMTCLLLISHKQGSVMSPVLSVWPICSVMVRIESGSFITFLAGRNLGTGHSVNLSADLYCLERARIGLKNLNI